MVTCSYDCLLICDDAENKCSNCFRGLIKGEMGGDGQCFYYIDHNNATSCQVDYSVHWPGVQPHQSEARATLQLLMRCH